jgi:hypothetical protein
MPAQNRHRRIAGSDYFDRFLPAGSHAGATHHLFYNDNRHTTLVWRDDA